MDAPDRAEVVPVVATSPSAPLNRGNQPPGAGPGTGGSTETSAEALLLRLGRRYGSTGRAVIAIACALIAPWSHPPAGFLITACVAVAFIAWNVVYLRRMLRSLATWCVATDTALVCALCLVQPWLESHRLLAAWGGWIVAVASFTVVAIQWQVRPVPAWLVTVAVCSAYLAGGVLAGVAWETMAAYASWLMVEAALSVLLWRLVRRSGRRADGTLARAFERDRQARTAAVQRADQRRHWAALHDTSAATLLMVGLGQVDGTEPWWRSQLERDLAALRPEEPADRLVELTACLDEAIRHSHIDVARGSWQEAAVPAPVGAAFGGATAELLENVRRHSGVCGARVELHVSPGRLEVTVRDAGRGFDPEAIPAGRHGVSWSVRERMVDVGGSARIESRPGDGTTVRLEWCRDD